MSYDLAVFNKRKAPVDTAGFISWYEKQTEGEDDLEFRIISVVLALMILGIVAFTFVTGLSTG